MYTDFKFFTFVFKCMSLLSEWMYVHHMHACLLNSEESFGYTGTVAMDGYEPPCGCRDPNLDATQEQQMLLTAGHLYIPSF